MRFAIVVSRFYPELSDELIAGAMSVFKDSGAEAVEIFDVPGAFELPFAALQVARTGRFVGIACLGAVIRGETSHYDHVCAEAARGIQDVGLHTGVPCGFGLLTVDSVEQARARAGGDKRNTGADAATAAMTLAAIAAELAKNED